ncbi:MAG TPA: 4Fe-4S ferredoxin [Chloroflexi bacterium]|nr:4Fe-4S ferredoxin [Chloroflexota bacterium]
MDRQRAHVPKGQVYIIPDRCKGCGICIAYCPAKVLRESSKSNGRGYHLPEVIPGKAEDCVHCQFCSLICPDFAIYTQEVPV